MIAGYLSLLFLTTFPKIVFSLYSRSEIWIHLYRLAGDPVQDYTLLGMELFGAVLAAMITVSISGEKPVWHLTALAVLMVPEALYMLSLPGPGESRAVVLAVLGLRISGFLAGYLIYRKIGSQN